METSYENLRRAIIERAVLDYCRSVKNIMMLEDKEYATAKILKDDKKRKEPRFSTLLDAEFERQFLIEFEIKEQNEIENFFHSKWYHTLLSVDEEYMINHTKQKAIDEIINATVCKLKKITEKNANKKRTIKALAEYKRLKNFLESKYIEKYTTETSEDIILRIEKILKNYPVTKLQLL